MSRQVWLSSAVVLFVCLMVAPAEATCFKCRQDTGGSGISCYMAEGNKGWCRPVGTSGCFSGGSCYGGGEDCGMMGGDPCEIENLLPGPTDERAVQCASIDRPLSDEYVLSEVIVLRVRPRVMVASVTR